jgi:hypothetical protein
MACLVALLAALPAMLGPVTALAQPTAPAPRPAPSQEPAATGTPAAGSDSPPDLVPAAGSATTPGVAEARTAFHDGTELARQQRWVEALEAFERSEALHPHAITTYNIGYCERLLGHATRASKMLAKALADHHARGDIELPAELVSAAQAYLSEADRQMARVVVTITPGAVAVDGRPLELAASEGPRPLLLAGTRAVGQPEVPPSFTFEVLLDPGTHVFVLSVKGRPDVVANQTLAPGSQISLELRLPETTWGTKPPATPAEPSRADKAGKPNRVPAFVALGIGAAGLAAGTVSGLIAFGKKGDVSNACTGMDTSSCASERSTANLAADISTGSFIGGGVAVGAGVLLFFTAPGSQTGPRAAASTPRGPEVRPMIGWGTLGLEGRF